MFHNPHIQLYYVLGIVFSMENLYQGARTSVQRFCYEEKQWAIF